jgi:hypothetical protein
MVLVKFIWEIRVEDKIDFYKGFGYKPVPGRDPIGLDNAKYFPMEYQVLNLPSNMG